MFHQAATSESLLKLMVEKMCFRLRGVHDLETTEHDLSAFGWSRSWSIMWSHSSGGSLGLEVIAWEK